MVIICPNSQEKLTKSKLDKTQSIWSYGHYLSKFTGKIYKIKIR